MALSFKSGQCCQEGLAVFGDGLCPSLLSRIYSSDNTTRFFSEEADWPGQIRVTVIGWTCTQAHDPGRCNPRSLLGIRIMKGGTRAEGGRTDAAAAHLSSSALNRLSVSSCSLEPWSCPGCCPLQGFCCSLDSMSFTKSTEIQNVFNGLFGVG